MSVGFHPSTRPTRSGDRILGAWALFNCDGILLKQHHTLCTAVCKEAVNPTQYLLWEHPFQPSPQQDSGLSDSAEAKFFRL
jgi:hypothetical protein